MPGSKSASQIRDPNRREDPVVGRRVGREAGNIRLFLPAFGIRISIANFQEHSTRHGVRPTTCFPYWTAIADETLDGA